MKHYKVKIVDGYSAESIYIHFWGILASVTVNNKLYKTINNEYNTPLFIEGLNTISIEEFWITFIPQPRDNIKGLRLVNKKNKIKASWN